MKAGRRLETLIFFFQAEDGIRDLTVTGVQTCALPISAGPGRRRRPRLATRSVAGWRTSRGSLTTAPSRVRSEERRVGKECRYGWATYLLNKNEKNMSDGVIYCVDNGRKATESTFDPRK